MRKFMADMVAAVAFFTAAAMVTEILFAGLTLAQSVQTRIVAVPFMIATARPYGLYRDRLFARFGVRQRGAAMRALFDTAIFMSFQLPVYAATLLAVGATPEQALVAGGGAVAGMLALARPYGLFLERVRQLFGVTAPPAESSGP